MDAGIFASYPRRSALDHVMASPTGPTLRVCLLHNYREGRQMSMKLYAEQLGAALERRGVLVTRVRPPEVLPERWRRFPLLDKVDSYVGRFAVYPRIARRLNADIFHVVDHGQGYLLKSLDPARTVVTCHDIILLVLASGRLGSAFRPPFAVHVLRHAVQSMRRTRWIISDSEQTRRDLASLVDIDPATVRVVYPGLNYAYRPMPEAREETRRKWLLGDGPVVLHVGQTEFYKNIEGCLRVIRELRRQGLNATFVHAGHFMRPSQQALRERFGLNGLVHDLGPLSNEDLASLYAASDVLLFPSLYEGFGWPPLEAMASGVPVVCSRSGSLPEVVGDAALTAEPEDVRGLTEHVAAALTDGKLADALRARGFARAGRFGWDRAASQILEIYGEVAAG
jgi:glycosyltransferase involved in cell wall biosynthesis